MTKNENAGTLIEVLAGLFPNSSRTSLRSWIKEGRVLVDNAPVVRSDAPVTAGSEVQLADRKRWVGKSKSGPTLRIIYEDPYLVAVEKPEGMLSVSTQFEKQDTAHALVKAHYHPKKVFVIHRLDQDTSGVMIFALDETCYHRLKTLFEKHAIDRIYYARVSGKPDPASGTWKSYLYEDASYRVHETDDPTRGELAITHYTLLETKGKSSILELKLETGKKNQIRVHCNSHGCPIIGDKKYGGTGEKRLFLHAQKLAFVHPMTQKQMTFISPVPESFR